MHLFINFFLILIFIFVLAIKIFILYRIFDFIIIHSLYYNGFNEQPFKTAVLKTKWKYSENRLIKLFTLYCSIF